jgi:hypothetical protein
MLFSMAIMPSLHAQDSEGGLSQKSDKTGTNPINFTFDARLYNEHQWLDVPGGGGQNITTFEFRAPFADGKWQFRSKVRATNLDIDRTGVDKFGLGDTDIRFLTVPYLDIPNKFAIATGVEFFIPTGSDDALSSNAFSIGPQIFLAFFAPFGGLFDLIAPGYQHEFSVWEEGGAGDIHKGKLDLFFLKTFNEKKQWVLLNPQGVLDYENDREIFVLDTEFGTMLAKPGHGVHVRPSFALTNERSYDFSIEAGYRVIW